MKKKGFTLIELLAVIIILGIIFLIAIPMVSGHINSSRKKTYINTVEQIIKAAVAKATSGELDIHDPDITYYVKADYFDLENGKPQSPYGKIDDAYVVITFDGDSYTYYYTGRDEQGMGIKDIILSDKINENSIVSNIGHGVITTNIGIGERLKLIVIDENGAITSKTASASIPVGGGSR